MDEKREEKLLKKYKQSVSEGKTPYFDALEYEDMLYILEQKDDYDDYDEILALGLSQHPESTELKIRKCRNFLRNGEFDEALEYFDEIGDENSEDMCLLRFECLCYTSKYSEIEDAIETLIFESPSFLKNVVTFVAVTLNDLRRCKDVVKYSKRALELYPDDSAIKDELAYALESLGRIKEAIKVQNEIIDQNPYSYDTWFNLGNLYMQDGQMEKALDAFEFALACNPKKQDEINIIKGYCHFLNDDYEEGARLYEEAAKASGYKNKQVDIFLGECYVYMQRYEDGYRTMTRYLKNFGEFEDPEMYLYYFFCCEEVGKTQRGVDYLNLGLEKFPYNVQLNTALILYCKKKGLEEEASKRISNLYKIMKNPPKKSKALINDLIDSDIIRFDEDGLRMFFKRVGEIVNMDRNMSVTDLSMGLFHFNKKGFKKPEFLTPEALGMSPDVVWEKNFVKNTMKDTPEARLTVVLAYKYMYNPDHNN